MALINIYAHEIRRGDYITHQRDARGGSGLTSGSSYVQAVSTEGDTVTVRRAAGVSDIDVTYNAYVSVWVDRD
jgi:hypothetical protein